MSDVECRSWGPEGTRCAKILGHHSPHGGMDRHGDWRWWV